MEVNNSRLMSFISDSGFVEPANLLHSAALCYRGDEGFIMP